MSYLKDKLVDADGDGADHDGVEDLVVALILRAANINDFPLQI